MEYSVIKVASARFWNKDKYFWSIWESDTNTPYSHGYAMTYNGAKRQAEFYMLKISDGRFINPQ